MTNNPSRKPNEGESWPRKVAFGRETVTVYRRLTPLGNPAFMVANYSGEKRRFDAYSTETDAIEAANKLARQLSQRDVMSASMTREQSIEYANAVQSLQPLDLSLSAAVAALVEAVKLTGDLASVAAAVRFYKAKHKAITPKSVAEAVAELLALKKSRGASERYLEDLKFRLEKFAAAFQCSIGSVTTAAVQAWLDGQKLSTQSYNNNRRVAHLLCVFAVSRNYAHDNPVAGVDKVKISNGDCEVFTPDEAAKLLASAPENFLPCLALGLFAGIRSAELERLKWQDIDLKQRHIVVGKSAAKTASRRIVPVRDNLALWLAPYAKRQGSVWPHGRISFHKHQQATAKAAGVRWKRNAMRHSFASYSFAMCNDAGRVAGECGNSAAVVHRHYRELVKPAAAERWFTVKPDAEQSAMTDAFAEQQEKAARRGSFKAKEAKENERRKLAMDGNFWCCLVFQSREQKNAFLKNAGLEGYGARYLDGRLVAKKFGVSIPEQTVKFQGEKEDAAMTLGFEPIEPLPATLTAKKPTGKSSSGKRKKAVLPKRVQIQVGDGGGEWGAIGDIALLPDGRIEWTDSKRITNGYVREEFFSGDEQRRLRITEPEKFLDTLVRWTGNAYARAIDMDTMAEYVLPQEDLPRKSARPEDIVPFRDDGD